MKNRIARTTEDLRGILEESLHEPGRRLLAGAVVSAVLAMVAPAWAATPTDPASEAPHGRPEAALAERFVPVDSTAAIPPPLVLSDLEGRRHDLAEYRGKVVVLNFWATWCAPCLAELPSLELLQTRLGQEPVVVLTVNHGESLERVSAFVDTMAMDLPVLIDAFHRVRHDWKVRALPMSFVIDRRGRLRYTVRGELDWASDESVARIVALGREQ